MAINHYDRLYIPGGAGALVTSETEFIRADRLQTECRFLIEAHGIERVILMVHGPADDGPAEALCGDYQRRLPTSSQADIRRRLRQISVVSKIGKRNESGAMGWAMEFAWRSIGAK